MLSDARWERIAPELSGKARDAGSSGRDNRLFVEPFFGLRAPARRSIYPKRSAWFTVYALLALGAEGVSGSGFSRLSAMIRISNMS